MLPAPRADPCVGDPGRVTVTGVQVPDEHRAVIRRWCAERTPPARRDRVQVCATERAGRVTLSQRSAPTFPELAAEWSTAPIAQLRYDPATHRWTLMWPDTGGRWHRYPDHARDTPEPLLAIVETDPTGIFWDDRPA